MLSPLRKVLLPLNPLKGTFGTADFWLPLKGGGGKKDEKSAVNTFRSRLKVQNLKFKKKLVVPSL